MKIFRARNPRGKSWKPGGGSRWTAEGSRARNILTRRPTSQNQSPIHARNLQLRCSDLVESFMSVLVLPDTRDFRFGLTSGKRLWSRAYNERNAAPPNGRRKQWADARRRCGVRDERERRDAARTKEHGNKRALVTAGISFGLKIPKFSLINSYEFVSW